MVDFKIFDDLFADYKFFEHDHYYTYKDKKVKTSVTQFISTKRKKFDIDKVSEYVAFKENRKKEDVIKEWEDKAYIACNLGTLFHQRSEQLAKNEPISLDFARIKKPLLEQIIKDKLTNLLPMQDNFFIDIKNKLIPIKTEYTVGIDDIIAGNIDLLCYNVKYDEIQIWDYKTNKNINLYNKYEKMFDEFSDLDKCEFVEYSIQLNIYREILERKLNKQIGDCYIIWFNSDNSTYRIFKCLNLRDKVKLALDNLIKKHKDEVKDD